MFQTVQRKDWSHCPRAVSSTAALLPLTSDSYQMIQKTVKVDLLVLLKTVMNAKSVEEGTWACLVHMAAISVNDQGFPLLLPGLISSFQFIFVVHLEMICSQLTFLFLVQGFKYFFYFEAAFRLLADRSCALATP